MKNIRVDCYNPTELLEPLKNVKLFSTTRGTMGDASGMLKVGKDIIKMFEYSNIYQLSELKEINKNAYEDCMDYWTNNNNEFNGWKEEDFFVIHKDCEYILVWEQK